jgi:hypothetical protein
LDLMIHHHDHKFVERCLRTPAKPCCDLRAVRDGVMAVDRPKHTMIECHMIGPVTPHVAKCGLAEGTDRV